MNRKKRPRLDSKQLWSERAAIRATFQAMVEEGLLVPTGEMRPSPIPGSTQGALLRHALVRLSPEHGEVIDLVYFHGKSVKEVAEIVGTAEATVKTRMFYARKKLAAFVAAA